jgi:hypothetical protein
MEKMIQTHDQEKHKKKRVSPQSVANSPTSEISDCLHSKFSLFFPETDISYLKNELVPRLSLGDPVLVIEWIDDGLRLASARVNAPNTAANCKATLINFITSPQCGGNDPTGNGNIFTFSSDPQFASCRNNLPQWSLTLGLRVATIANLGPPVTPVGIAQVIRATNRVVPDITLESFFEIR